MRTAIAGVLLAATSLAAATPREEIEPLLKAQAEAWSRGDLDAFCSSYADDATFVSPSGLTQGRQAVLERYRAKYKDKAGMGRLTLAIVEVRPGAADVVSVVARWTLAWPDKPEATGLTLLVFHRQKGAWKIVQDASM